MTPSRLLVLLLRSRKRNQRGFGLLLALLAALVTMLSAVSLLIRGQNSLLGDAQQSQARMAREAAEAGLSTLIGELNRPGNRRLLVATVPFTAWKASAESSDTVTKDNVTNPCLYSDKTTDPESQKRLDPSASLLEMANANGGTVTLLSNNSRFRRRFILQRVRLSNNDRTRWYESTRNAEPTQSTSPFNDSQINFNDASNTGHIELAVEGQLLPADANNNQVIATATVTREYPVIPKCCQQSPGGPGQMFGNDFRWCTTSPPFVVGLGNDEINANGGVHVLQGAKPELRLRTDPNEPSPEILCYMPSSRKQACVGDSSITDAGKNKTIPVRTDSLQFPPLPGLDEDGKPCVSGTSGCDHNFEGKDAYSIEVFDQNNGASTNDKDNKYAKDYLRVHPNGEHVEICNKKYTADPASPYYAKPASPGAEATLDTTPDIVDESCVNLSQYCARLVRNGLATYHCRIRNIFVNDFGATNDANVRQNNTLFIDTSFGPIYLYIYDQWAKKRPDLMGKPDDAVLLRMKQFGYQFDKPVSEYAPIYTVGGYNDGQIQHVHCNKSEFATVNFACTRTDLAAAEMARAEIISNISNTGITSPDDSSQDYAALIGDDGFVRDLFFWMPKASFHLAGDPTTMDAGGDLAQGKPQLSAGMWVNTFRFVRQSSELYLPSRKDKFFPFLLSTNDRLAAPIHDWIARSASVTSLFR